MQLSERKNNKKGRVQQGKHDDSYVVWISYEIADEISQVLNPF